MNIRPALRSDATQLAALLAELGYDIAPADIEAKLEQPREGADAVFVAENNGELSGLITCHIIPCFHQVSPLGRITSLVVKEAWRGKGVGKLLLQKADQFFRDSGCKRVEVSSADHRREAHKFYEHCGFKPDSRRFLKVFA